MLPYLPPSATRLLDRLLDQSDRGWFPLPGPQMQAFFSEADELFYGGAAGGGKSDLLLGLSHTEHYQTIIFRREFPQIKGLEERMTEIMGSTAGYNSQRKFWRLPGGRSLEFGSVPRLGDEVKYQGRPHDLKAFDEITHFLEAQYRFLIGWTRTSRPGQRTRAIATGNPPTTPEGEWVVQYWGPWLDPQHPNPAKPGELRWFATIDGKDVELDGPEPFMHKGELVEPKSRTFIPARVEDNPYLMASGYKRQLQNLPEPLRTRMLLGTFGMERDDDPWQVIPTAWVDAAMERWSRRSKPDLSLTATGVDVARGGKDKTVIAKRHGNWLDELEAHPGSSTPDGPKVAALVVAATRGKGTVNIDIIGVGASAYDSLTISLDDVVGLNGAAGSKAKDRTGKLGFLNKRAEWYWHLREILDPEHGEDIALPPDRELRADLTAPRWKLTTRGIQVESKDDIQARIGRSPDKGDAAVYAFAEENARFNPIGV